MRFLHSTAAQLRRAVRDELRQPRAKDGVPPGVRLMRAAKWLHENCTNVQLGALFNLSTPAEVAALRVRLQAKIQKLAEWESAQAAARVAAAAADSAANAEGGE